MAVFQILAKHKVNEWFPVMGYLNSKICEFIFYKMESFMFVNILLLNALWKFESTKTIVCG